MQKVMVCHGGTRERIPYNPHIVLEGAHRAVWFETQHIPGVKLSGEGHWLIDGHDQVHFFPMVMQPAFARASSLGIRPDNVRDYLGRSIDTLQELHGLAQSRVSVTADLAGVMWSSGLLEPMHLQSSTESSVHRRGENGFGCDARITTQWELGGVVRELIIVPGQLSPIMVLKPKRVREGDKPKLELVPS